MKLSQNFTKTIRDAPSDETSKNAQLLIRAGYIHKTMAGVYSYLPLGLRMINKIENIVRKHLNGIGGQEILMNSLHPKEWWLKANRWDNVDILFKLNSQTKTEYALACSHEEQVTPIVQQFVNSWKDLPEYQPIYNYKGEIKLNEITQKSFRFQFSDFNSNRISKDQIIRFNDKEYSTLYKIKNIFIDANNQRDILDVQNVNLDYDTVNGVMFKKIKFYNDDKTLPDIKDRNHTFCMVNLELYETNYTRIFPLAVYQIQTKFRDELRAKSGLLRGREFRMKDMYDFHATKESADAYYELVKATYFKIYQEMGLQAYAVHASGGIFTSNDSHEFQVISPAGEDEIFYDEKTGYAINSEIVEEMKAKGQNIPEGLSKAISAEVGNIFKLDDKYTKAFGVTFVDRDNKPQTPLMNCHGIGTSRCMAILAEIYSDEKGLKLPAQVAPFELHLITNINVKDDPEINTKIQDIANRIYNGELKLIKKSKGGYNLLDTSNINQLLELAKEDNSFDLNNLGKSDQILWDDRAGKVSIGEKLKDADLIGCPVQIVISKRSIENGGLEVITRNDGEKFVVSVY